MQRELSSSQHPGFSSESLTLMESIKHAIQDSHDAIEKTTFAEGMMNATITLESYTFYLRQMLAIHEPLDHFLDLSTLRDWVPSTAKRSAAIRQDIALLNPLALNDVVLPATREIVQDIQQSYEANPLSLLGHFYILEGSRMGSRVIAKPLQSLLRIPSEALHYHLDNFDKQPRALREFRNRLNQEIDSPEQKAVIQSAAVTFMNQLLKLYGELPASEDSTSTGGLPVDMSSMGRCPFGHGTTTPSGNF